MISEGEELFGLNSLSVNGSSDHFLEGEMWVNDECFGFELKVVDNSVHTFCDCEGQKNKPCSHLWTAILWADKFKAFKKGAGRGRFAGTAASQQGQPASKPDLSELLPKPSFQIQNL